MSDQEFRTAAKVSAHEKVMKAGGPGVMSMGEMVNIGVDVGVDYERIRVQSVLRRKGYVAMAAELEEDW